MVSHIVAEFAHYVASKYDEMTSFEPIASDGCILKPKAEIPREEYEKLKEIIQQNPPEVKSVDVEFRCLDCKYKDTSATEEPCNCCYGGSHFVKLED